MPILLRALFSGEMIDECVGEDIISQYKRARFYLEHREWILDNYPLMSDAAHDAQEVGYIDINQKGALLTISIS